jgi:hypothetical protein
MRGRRLLFGMNDHIGLYMFGCSVLCLGVLYRFGLDGGFLSSFGLHLL